MSFAQSILQLHNETLNIWTHLLGFLAFAAILFWDFLSFPSKITWEVKKTFQKFHLPSLELNT
jgi:predicted membrane channel-forming protein YqfA (hemolysin III family)